MLRLVPSTDQEENVAADWLEHNFVSAQGLTSPSHNCIVGHEFTGSKKPSDSLQNKQYYTLN